MKEEKKYLEGTKIEDLRGMKFGKLSVIDFDWDRYESDKIRKINGEIKSTLKCWKCKCDCKKEKIINGSNLTSNRQTSCGVCYTFEDWCLDNNHQDYLDLWDYELNNKKPSEIGYGVGKKYYFKCLKNTHESDLWSIANVTSINKKSGSHNSKISCRKCNSFGEYLLDTYGNLDLWSNKNIINPFTISKKSSSKVFLTCQDCGYERCISAGVFATRKQLSCTCGDGQSYPNKFMFNVLNQLGIDFKSEYAPKWAKDNTGTQRRYDFYIPSKNLIIEMDGGIGHGNKVYGKSKSSIKDTKRIDKWKDNQAKLQGLEVIRIDCIKSELNYIMRNVLMSDLNNIFNMSRICWEDVGKFSLSNQVKEMCDLWMTRRFRSIKEICEYLKIGKTTAHRYFRQGVKYGWCDYDSKEEMKKSGLRSGETNSKKVEILQNGDVVGVFKSITELESQSFERFGTKLLKCNMSKVCRGNQRSHKGFTFRYV